jgi:transposase
VGIRVKTMAEICRIVDLYDLYGSYRRVSRELGISRNTVKKYVHRVKDVQNGLADEILPKDRKIVQLPRVMTDEVRQKIHDHLDSNLKLPRKQRLTAKRIWELLIKDGHKLGYTTVKDEVARWKRLNSHREVYILQEPRVGHRAEFDWGEVQLCIGGVWQKIYLAVFVLTFSLYRFARLYTRSSHLEVIHAHNEFFHEIGAVPEKIFYDRMAAVYDSSTRKLNETFLDYSMHSGFQICICNPASPHEKGTDEESVGYIRRATFGERSSFESFEEAKEWLVGRLAEINTNPVYRRSQVPADGLALERAQMKPLPSLEYESYDLRRAAISRYSLVKCDGNFYSVPDTYRPRQITLKVLVDQIDLLDGDRVVASHRRLTGTQRYSLDITHYIKTFNRKPGAITNSKVLAQSDEQIQDLFNQYYRDDPKQFLSILDLIRESSAESLTRALTILNRQHIPPTYDMLRFFLHQSDLLPVEPSALDLGFEVPEPDLAAFDRMMGG